MPGFALHALSLHRFYCCIGVKVPGIFITCHLPASLLLLHWCKIPWLSRSMSSPCIAFTAVFLVGIQNLCGGEIRGSIGCCSRNAAIL